MTNQSQEVEPHIFDAEIVDDIPQTIATTRWRRFMNWWQRSPRVPAFLKSRRAAKGAALDALAFTLRSPWRLLTGVGRGTVTAIRSWRLWIRVYDYREAAEQSEKLADKFTEIRALTLFRWKVTGAVAVAAGVLVAVADLLYGVRALWTVGGLLAVALAIIGRRKDGAPGRKAVLAGPRTLAWTMDPQILVDAFRDAKLIGKDETLRLVERAHHDGAGWAVTVDLPATRKAADVLKNRDALASALAVDELQLIVERVRGRGGHAGRVFLWVADEDPYSGAALRFPLLEAESWDTWRPIPFGRDARQRKIALSVVWTSILIGAIPRQGKTCATRLPAAGLVLDPYTQLYVFDGKGGKDWQAAEAVTHRFVCGDELEHIEAVRDHLVELVAEVQARFARMSTLDDELCPDSKITRAISRDPSLGMPITAVIIDEVQVYLECAERHDIGGKKTTLGAHIADLLTYLARKGPAVGVVIILATQRPDSTTIPSRLRAVLGSRFALRVMDWRDSNIVLGEQMNTRGYDASTLLPSHKGVGILRPDGDSDEGADTVAVTVRTYYMDNTQWRAICERGRALREAAGTLTGHAAGDDSRQAVDQTAVVKALGTAGDEAPGDEWPELPEPLASIVDNFGEDLAPNGREFIPTSELTATLEADPSTFARDMNECGCKPTRNYVTSEDGSARRVRGYLTADIRAAIEQAVNNEISSHAEPGAAQQ
jgi:S-DNA-T family DNA segregation ATPase FtsK/SpoIIIE